MSRAVFPGTFDPPSFGHLNIIKRAAKLYDKLDVVIAINPNKKNLFSASERFEMLQEILCDLDNVRIVKWDKLIVDYAKENQIKAIIRGVRALSDFQYEFELALMNKALAPEIETIFLPTETTFLVHRSSSIKELVQMGGDISSMVPDSISKYIKKKLI